jgi:proteasome accessory factor A
MDTRTDRGGAPARLLKVCGADVEVGNFILGDGRGGSTAPEAARLLLDEIRGVGQSGAVSGPCECFTCRGRRASGASAGTVTTVSVDPQDRGRRFLTTNGGCVYIDLDHLEICLPEVTSAFDHAAAWHAMLRVARAARRAANLRQPDGRSIEVLVNNSDGRGSSFGSHLNVLVTRRTWDNLFTRKLHQLLFLAAYQASSQVFTGQGKVGSENGAPPVAYQISQRADFIETLVGPQTTWCRPLVNSRDEPLSGPESSARADGARPARLHVIFYDSTLAHVASVLKIGVLQMVLAMIEADCIDPRLALDDPVDAVHRWSHDPTLRAAAATADGLAVTAVELQFRFLEAARRFADEGGFDEVVPRAGELLALWESTLLLLRDGDFDRLAARLDWVLKLQTLRRAARRGLGDRWDAPELKHLDHLYASLDDQDGLYWAFERAGLVERVVDDEAIERLVDEPPPDTRAWGRAMLLRRAGDRAESANWDYVRVRTGTSGWRPARHIPLDHPLAFTRDDVGGLLADDGLELDEIADALEGYASGATRAAAGRSPSTVH